MRRRFPKLNQRQNTIAARRGRITNQRPHWIFLRMDPGPVDQESRTAIQVGTRYRVPKGVAKEFVRSVFV
jgi:hypothetical protein